MPFPPRSRSSAAAGRAVARRSVRSALSASAGVAVALVAASLSTHNLAAQGTSGTSSQPAVSGTAAQSSPVARYPLAPTPVLDARILTPGPAFSGYLSARSTRRNDSTANAINRARITVMGMPYRGLAYRLQADFSAATRIQRDSSVPASVLTDAYVQLFYATRTNTDSTSPRATLMPLAALAPALIVGQFRVPFSLEYLTPFSLMLTANRSLAVDRLSPRRDIGVMAQVRLTRFAVLMGSVTNGEGPNQPRNPDNKELASGRLVLRPLPSLALAGKWAGAGADHYWGYDGRWLWRAVTLEGEVIRRTGRAPGSTAAVPARPAPPGAPGYDASGGYALAAWRVVPWLEPVVKWEQLRERTAATPQARDTWVTPGVVLRGLSDRARFHVNWIVKRARPVSRRANELQAQLVAIF